MKGAGAGRRREGAEFDRLSYDDRAVGCFLEESPDLLGQLAAYNEGAMTVRSTIPSLDVIWPGFYTFL
jgi:hypothetical protein